MQQSDGAAPAWLFSFVDLAFLMLIAMTQLAPDPGAKIPNLGEMIVPKVGAKASTEMGDSAAEVWQLRVHPPEERADPYELVRIVDGAAPPGDSSRYHGTAVESVRKNASSWSATRSWPVGEGWVKSGARSLHRQIASSERASSPSIQR